MSAKREIRRRLLLVDDQPANVRLLAEALKDEYDLSFATSGAKALELAGDADLVLLDVVMPELDGFEVCRRLKADPRTAAVPVIFVTASDETDDETRGFDLGAVDYIVKPVRAPIVRARVRTHLELKATRELLEQKAWLDPLTGIPNRRRLDACLEADWQRASRNGRPLSLALLDVDDFKRFNDTYGHARGDACLRQVAAALAAATNRPGDLVARYGGEEFAVVAPETDGEGMRQLVHALLDRVEELAIPHADSRVADHVTLSVGALTLLVDGEGSADEAVETVDRLLYEAKEGGRAHGVHADSRLGVQQRIDGPTTRRPEGGER